MDIRGLWFAVVLFCCSSTSEAKPVVIAVASNFYHPLTAILAGKVDEQEVRIVAASSGILFQQIQRGAPFDLFFSADHVFPKKLYDTGLSYIPLHYTTGVLVWWEPNSDSPHKVSQPVAIPHPELAPYGQVAQTQVQYHNHSNWVISDNVLHAFQLVDLGHSSAGFTAKSVLKRAYELSKNDKYNRYQDLPIADLSLAQHASVLKRSENVQKAKEILNLILSPTTQCDLVKLGYKSIHREYLC